MTLGGKRDVIDSRVLSVSWEDRIVRNGIVGAGLITLVLLAWAHLGLGAWVIPPATTASQQITVAGPYRVTLREDSGQLTAAGPNSLSFSVQDQARHPLTEVKLAIQATMTTMAMQAPTISVIAAPEGSYITRPIFGMAGDWRLTLIIYRTGERNEYATFVVSVRWR